VGERRRRGAYWLRVLGAVAGLWLVVGGETGGAGASAAVVEDDRDASALFVGLELGADFLLVEDHPSTYDQAFPRLVPTDLAVEHRAFRGGHQRRYVSLVDPLSVRVLVVDMTDRASASAAVQNPQQVRLQPPDEPGRDRRSFTKNSQTGQIDLLKIVRHGRFVVYVDARGPAIATDVLAATAESVVAQITAGHRPADVSRAPPPARSTDFIMGGFALVWTWYLLASAVTGARDKTIWQRLASLLSGHRDPTSAFEAHGTQVISVAMAAKTHRVKLAAWALYWWVTRSLALVVLASVVVSAALGHVLGLICLLVGAVAVVLVRKLRSRRVEARLQERYRRVSQALSPPVRIALWTLLTGMLVLLFLSTVLASALHFVLQSVEPDRFTAGTELSILFLILALWALTLPFREATKVARAGIERVLGTEKRPPVVLLRSFGDDPIRIRTRRGRRHTLLERLSLRRFDLFEETVAWQLWRYGPVAAAADPNRSLPPLGAARNYYAHDDWRNAIRQLIIRSPIVAVIMGTGGSLQWEIAEIDRLGVLGRTVFVLPPVDDYESDLRLGQLLGCLQLHVPYVPQRTGRGHVVLAVVVDESRQPTFVTGRFRDDVSYELAIERAVACLPPPPPVPDPATLEPLPKPLAVPTKPIGQRVLRAGVLCLPAFGLMVTAWLFMAYEVVEFMQYSTERRENGPPYYLANYRGPAPAWGVATGEGRVVSYDLVGNVQILAPRVAGGDQRFTIPDPPTAVALTGNTAVFAHLRDDRLTIVDMGNPTDRRSVDVPAPYAVAADGDIVAAVSARDGMLALGTRTDEGVRMVPVGGTPVAVELDSSQAFVVDAAADSVTVVDTASASVLTRFEVCRGPRDLLVDDDQDDGGELVVVCELDGTVARYTRSGQPSGGFAVGLSPATIARTPSGFAVVDRGGDSLLLVEEGRVVATLGTGAGGTQVATDSDGDYIYVAIPSDDEIGAYDAVPHQP
jgi:hypothetical protein